MCIRDSDDADNDGSPKEEEAADDEDDAAGFPVKHEGRDAAPPHHCSASFEEVGKERCQGPRAVTAKQRLQIGLYGALTQTPLPDVESMDYTSAGEWARARWLEYMSMEQD